MNRSQLVERVDRVAAACVSLNAGHGELTAALDDVARLESWAASRRAELVRLLKVRPDAFPESDVAESTGCTLGAATKETERADTLETAESFADALDDGDIRPGHVDALTRTCKNLDDEQQDELLAEQDELVERASSLSISAFEKLLKRKAAALQSDRDAENRLERQKRAIRFRSWIDQADGMWCVSGRFDPETGRDLQRLLDATVTSMFANETPDTAPTDRLERQQHMNGLALINLIKGTAPGGSRPGPPLVVVDATATHTANTSDGGTPDVHVADTTEAVAGAASSTGVDWGIPIELPMSVLRDIFDINDADVVVIAGGIIVHATGNLDLGRTTRLASRHQRRALRALYSSCAVPGCSVHYDRCKLHHIIWWRNGGRTDLDNLLPVCQHHHTRVHNDNWHIHLGPARELTITLPDGQTLSGQPSSAGQLKPRAA